MPASSCFTGGAVPADAGAVEVPVDLDALKIQKRSAATHTRKMTLRCR